MNRCPLYCVLVAFSIVTFFSSGASAQPPGGGETIPDPPTLINCDPNGCYVPLADTDSCAETFGAFVSAPELGNSCPNTNCEQSAFAPYDWECVNAPDYEYKKVSEANWNVERSKFTEVTTPTAGAFRCSEWALNSCYNAFACSCIEVEGIQQCAKLSNTTQSENLGFYYMVRNLSVPCMIP